VNSTERVDADVVVVGGGGAGLAAAIEAARLGRQVAMLEKTSELGGTTGRRSVGSVSAACTPLQKNEGIKDSPQEFFEDMALFAGDRVSRDNLELRWLLAEQSADTLSWLMSLGIEFLGPFSEPPHRYPRMHTVLPNSKAYTYSMARRARKEGVKVHLRTRAQRLVWRNGRVAGVEASVGSGKPCSFVAREGVVLAAGDYSSNKEMKEAYVGPAVANIEGINPSSTGDGQRLALEVGARIVNRDLVWGPEIRFVAPPPKMLVEALPPVKPIAKAMKFATGYLPAWLFRRILMMFVTTNLAPSPAFYEEGGILVNRSGERFTNEGDKPELAIPEQPDRVAFFVLDERIARKFSRWPHVVSTAPGIAYAYLPDYHNNRKDIYYQAPTIEELARQLGLSDVNLARTVAAYNSDVSKGRDSAFGREPPGPALTEPPFHALGPAKSWILVTEGGVAVTTQMEVLGADDQAIPGLYAAGSNGQGGVLLEGHGNHLGWAFTSGRIAGHNAAFGSQTRAKGPHEEVGRQS
jgi:succinate dehydrogenase/fumarate reductase flavoprotein subunit